MSSDSDNVNQRIEFGGFTLDARARQISYAGDSLNATDRTFEFLWMLAERPGELVAKDDLMERLWPEQFVTEASLSRLVSDTRRLLAEHNPDEELIQTVRGRGFRLRVAAAPLAAEAAPEQRTNAAVWVAGAIAVVAVAALVGTMLLQTPARSLPEPTADSGTVLILPVQVGTGDVQDTWVRYGIMAMLTQQLQSYPELSVMGADSVIRGLADIGYETPAASVNGTDIDAATFAQICDALGCGALVALRLDLQDDQLVLQYRLRDAASGSALYRFMSNDALDAAEMLSEHLLARLMPNSRERLDLQPYYTDDPIANRNLALGASSLYHADYPDAKVYLELALRREPEFFWAQLFLADTVMRMGSYEQAEAFLIDIESRALSPRESLETNRLRENLLYAAGELQASQQASLETVRLAEALGDHERMGMALMNTGTSFTAMGDAGNAREYLDRAVEVFREHGFALRTAQAEFNLANAMQVDGADGHELAELYRRAAATFLNCNATTYQAYALKSLGDVNRNRNRYGEAKGQLERASELFAEAQDREGELFVDTSLAALAIDTRDLDAAQHHARRAYDEAGSQFTYLRSYAAFLLTHIALLREQLTAIPPLLAEVESAEWQDPRPPYALLSASYSHKRGDLDQAVSLARGVRDSLGANWTDMHQAYLDVFEASVAEGRVIEFDYFAGTPALQ